MDSKEIEALQAAATELEKIKEQNRLRARRFLDRRAEAGKRQISAILHNDAYEEINRRRDRSILAGEPLTAGQIIEQALNATSDFINADGTIDIDLILAMFNAYEKYVLCINDNVSVSIDENTNIETTAVIEPPAHDRAWLKGEVERLKDTGLTLAQIKADLETRSIKTARGLDVWSIGTIGKILKKGR